MKWACSIIAIPLCLACATQTLSAQTVDSGTETGGETLITAVAAGDLEAVKKIAGPHNVNTREESPWYPDEEESGRTPLVMATEQGNVEIVKVLVESGARIGDTYTYPQTPSSSSNEESDQIKAPAIARGAR